MENENKAKIFDDILGNASNNDNNRSEEVIITKSEKLQVDSNEPSNVDIIQKKFELNKQELESVLFDDVDPVAMRKYKKLPWWVGILIGTFFISLFSSTIYLVGLFL